MRYLIGFLILSILISCSENQPKTADNAKISGDVIIFHAGSLAVPFQKVAQAFEQEYPGTRVLLEAAGSVDCARKITDLKKPCDLMASSDYKVITKFLIPEYTSWYLPFAGNDMVLAFTGKSHAGEEISSDNWHQILLIPEVHYGRSDPDADPCGYRTVMVMQLASALYGIPDLASNLAGKDMRYIRPKEVDLLALLELNEVDYIFIYRSVAIQHNLQFLELPDAINLKNPAFNEQYEKAVVKIKGKDPSSSTEVSGEAITYAITRINAAPNPLAADAFLRFLADPQKGVQILKQAGHTTSLPLSESVKNQLPDHLKIFLNN